MKLYYICFLQFLLNQKVQSESSCIDLFDVDVAVENLPRISAEECCPVVSSSSSI